MTNELRDVLTEAICPSVLAIMRFPDQLYARRLSCRIAETILRIPGVAVIQLPEPSYVDEPEAGMKGVGFNGGPRDTHLSERGVYAHDGMVYDQWDGVTPADALKVAGWWAAAAVVAEGEDK